MHGRMYLSTPEGICIFFNKSHTCHTIQATAALRSCSQGQCSSPLCILKHYFEIESEVLHSPIKDGTKEDGMKLLRLFLKLRAMHTAPAINPVILGRHLPVEMGKEL